MREDFVQVLNDLEIFCGMSARLECLVLLIVPASKDLRGAASPFNCGMEPANP